MQYLNYKDYQGSIELNLEDGYLHGQVMFITDLVVFEGKTIEELRSSFQSAVDGYIAYCQETNQEPCRPFKGSFNVRISPELHKQLAEYAAQNDKTQNEVVKEAISEKIERLGHSKPASSAVTLSTISGSCVVYEMQDNKYAALRVERTRPEATTLPVEHTIQ